MPKTKTIPIFPLDLVLFPHQLLPLQIFEPRYKQMIDDCMLSDKEFGGCLSHKDMTVANWEAPYNIGTIAKISDCKDVDSTSGNLIINSSGRSKFRILRMIPPALEQPNDYDPISDEGKEKIANLHEKSGFDKKMYIQAEVELINEIEEPISLKDWEHLIDLWKKKTAFHALPKTITSHELDHLLEQYDLKTEMPTIDYVHSLCALGATTAQELQPILEANSIEQLLERCEDLLRT